MGECYGVFEGEELVGEYVLLPPRPFTVEYKLPGRGNNKADVLPSGNGPKNDRGTSGA
ncbi:hypothetical protein [Culturomica massiliensis]|uniref:hypothetical protein n=1 Tax=Culturomica massiliensis TaxID=1841857 RepID=UPI0012B508D5|nr:hypothetical protein [Culturomica massiliensis]